MVLTSVRQRCPWPLAPACGALGAGDQAGGPGSWELGRGAGPGHPAAPGGDQGGSKSSAPTRRWKAALLEAAGLVPPTCFRTGPGPHGLAGAEPGGPLRVLARTQAPTKLALRVSPESGDPLGIPARPPRPLPAQR